MDSKTRYCMLLNSVSVQALQNVLVAKGIITDEEVEEEAQKVIAKDQKFHDKCEFDARLETIISKGNLSEKDENYILKEGGKFYTSDQLESILSSMKIDKVMDEIFDTVKQN